MKTVALVVALLAVVSLVSGCKSSQAEKEAYFNSGSMDEQVQSWQNVPGGRR
jgi:outer membrane lipoprotein SlyB